MFIMRHQILGLISEYIRITAVMHNSGIFMVIVAHTDWRQNVRRM